MYKNNFTSFIISLFTIFLLSCSDSNIEPEIPSSPKLNELSIIKLTANDTITKENSTIGTLTEMSSNGDILTETPITIKGRGNTTWNASDKKPYKVKMSKKHQLAGMPAEKSWIFLSNPLDSSMLRNEVGFQLSRMSNLEWTPNSSYADIFLNDDYRGTYQICDKVDISKTKLNIGKNGYLIETTPKNRLTKDEVYIKTPRRYFAIEDFDPKDKDSDTYKYLSDYVNYCEEAICSPKGIASNGKTIDELIDVESFVDWYLINEIMKNVDSRMFASCKLHLTLSSKLYMGPVWDFDLSLGNVMEGHAEHLKSPEGLYIATGAWFADLIWRDFFLDKVKERYSYFYSNKDELIKYIRSKAQQIHNSAIHNGERWNNGVDFDYEVDKMIKFLSQRMDWLYKYWFATTE